MATFKVGQRVRIVGGPLSYRGREGQITRIDRDSLPYVVRIEGTFDSPHLAPTLQPDEWGYTARELAPLTPPDESADRFLEKIKSWGPLSEPLRESIVVTEDATYSVKGESVQRISK